MVAERLRTHCANLPRSLELGQHVLPHELDGLHDLLVGNLVGVDQAEEEIGAGGFIRLQMLDDFVGVAGDTTVRLAEVLEGQQLVRPRLDELVNLAEPIVRAEPLLLLLQSLR